VLTGEKVASNSVAVADNFFMGTYSMDLRDRVLAVCYEGELVREEIGEALQRLDKLVEAHPHRPEGRL
jgi:hypothetical protein